MVRNGILKLYTTLFFFKLTIDLISVMIDGVSEDS